MSEAPVHRSYHEQLEGIDWGWLLRAPLTVIPTRISKVENLGDPSKPWSVRWQTGKMATPAWWYFASEAKAVEAARGIGR